jgi:hypothetical protein
MEIPQGNIMENVGKQNTKSGFKPPPEQNSGAHAPDAHGREDLENHHLLEKTGPWIVN